MYPSYSDKTIEEPKKVIGEARPTLGGGNDEMAPLHKSFISVELI